MQVLTHTFLLYFMNQPCYCLIFQTKEFCWWSGWGTTKEVTYTCPQQWWWEPWIMPGGFFRIMIHSQNPTHPPTCRTGVFVETVSLCPHQMRISAARERECITSYELFYNLCIHRHVLELVIRARCDIRVEPLDFSMASFWKAGYRQFILWEHGYLGKGSRRVIPSCAVNKIRNQYPSPDNVYMGFRAE